VSSSNKINEKRYTLDLNYDWPTYLEFPSFDTLGDFYDQNGLILTTPKEIQSSKVLHKLNCALALFKHDKALHESINLLIRDIQVVNQPHPEIDISHSDPKIPFSIFVSVCDDDSPISNLRVAESILHEAMHLKLTLLESAVPLVKHIDGNLYYSPWRDEKRSARGVLHGLFVFAAILNFYQYLHKNVDSHEAKIYLSGRKKQITKELNSLERFPKCVDLTADGASLARNLLPLS